MTDDLLDLIHAQALPPLGEGEITMPQYMARYGVSRNEARSAIDRAVLAGLLVDAGWRMCEGRRVRAYRRA